MTGQVLLGSPTNQAITLGPQQLVFQGTESLDTVLPRHSGCEAAEGRAIPQCHKEASRFNPCFRQLKISQAGNAGKVSSRSPWRATCQSEQTTEIWWTGVLTQYECSYKTSQGFPVQITKEVNINAKCFTGKEEWLIILSKVFPNYYKRMTGGGGIERQGKAEASSPSQDPAVPVCFPNPTPAFAPWEKKKQRWWPNIFLITCFGPQTEVFGHSLKHLQSISGFSDVIARNIPFCPTGRKKEEENPPQTSYSQDEKGL